jgi:hypothetical protein
MFPQPVRHNGIPNDPTILPVLRKLFNGNAGHPSDGQEHPQGLNAAEYKVRLILPEQRKHQAKYSVSDGPLGDPMSIPIPSYPSVAAEGDRNGQNNGQYLHAYHNRIIYNSKSRHNSARSQSSNEK